MIYLCVIETSARTQLLYETCRWEFVNRHSQRSCVPFFFEALESLSSPERLVFTYSVCCYFFLNIKIPAFRYFCTLSSHHICRMKITVYKDGRTILASSTAFPKIYKFHCFAAYSVSVAFEFQWSSL